ncbi:MAG: hypothetical protein AB1898_16805 [Acidobacteriota bacterium]
MPLSKKELMELMRLVGLTREGEINCERCLSLVAEFAEQELAGRSVSEGLKVVRHHLLICAECREEYAALQKALREIDG